MYPPRPSTPSAPGLLCGALFFMRQPPHAPIPSCANPLMRRPPRAPINFGVILLETQRKCKGNPAREARRGKFRGQCIGNTKEIQRKSGARSAPGEDFVVLFRSVQGNTKGNPAREARRRKNGPLGPWEGSIAKFFYPSVFMFWPRPKCSVPSSFMPASKKN